MVIARELGEMSLTAKREGRDSLEVWLKQQAIEFLVKRQELCVSRGKEGRWRAKAILGNAPSPCERYILLDGAYRGGRSSRLLSEAIRTGSKVTCRKSNIDYFISRGLLPSKIDTLEEIRMKRRFDGMPVVEDQNQQHRGF